MDVTEQSFIIPENWDVLSKKLKTTYEHLTDADLKYEIGRQNELLASIGSRLHKKREEIIKIIDDIR